LLSLLSAAAAGAAAASVVVEIDSAAERVVDARSARRLVPLELADVAVPAAAGVRGAPVLFFRVLGRADGGVRIELWERGEYHGARTLSGAGETPQLVARRVALAAAELGRRLARKREATLLRDQRLRQSREARAREERERRQEGPAALRPELSAAGVPGKLWLFGERLTGELSLHGALRLDVGGELWAGSVTPNLHAELQGITLGPGYRLVLSRQLDLDLGVQAAALLVQVPEAVALDAVPNQDSSWTARLNAAARFELGLSRQLRAILGLEAGGLLRSMSYVGAENEPERLRGSWWGASLGVVVTPR